MKEIWIFNHHALTPKMSGGTRHFDFAKELVKRGYRVVIFASSFHYSQYKELKVYEKTYFLEEELDGVEFIWIKTRPYIGNGLGRVLNMFDYMKKVQKIALNLDRQPDVIIGSSVHLFAVYAAYKIARRMNIPFIMEVRDIWPQTLIDMGVFKWHPFILLLGYLEKFLYKKADKIITNLPYAYEHIQKFGINKEDIVWISNGVDLSLTKSLDEYKFNKEQFHITYAGSLGQANQLDVLVEAAASFEGKDVEFHILGDGIMLEVLKKMKTKNVHIYGALSKKDAISMMKGSDVLFFPLADSPVFKFGISSNKLFDYLASKKPVIFASNAKNNPIKEADAGISISAGSSQEIIMAVKRLQAMTPSERERLGENGFTYVSKYFTIPKLVDKLEDCIFSLVYNTLKKRDA